ncbi:MAG TPA: NYN domain-containing protein [Candidatus Dormibacteraeota bacterium]|jgi:predicted RNA-binding protein with PIN domain|nr:NYN domain-containing protein [Candidatus Dormibacteraeota bacterium]
MQALIVDGYNIIHAWPALHATLRERGLDDARRQLVSALAEYAAQTGVAVTVVFDAHGRPGAIPSTEKLDGVTVLFGSKRASADHVIERAAYRASQRGEGADVVVATDDRLERDVVGAMGVATMGARALEAEVARVAGSVGAETKRMREDSRRRTRLEDGLDPEIRRRLERMRRGEDS